MSDLPPSVDSITLDVVDDMTRTADIVAFIAAALNDMDSLSKDDPAYDGLVNLMNEVYDNLKSVVEKLGH